MLALKAMLAGTGKPLGGERERRIDIAVDGRTIRSVVVPLEQADVLQLINLSEHMATGTHRLTLQEASGTASGYQVVSSHHVPDAPADIQPEALSVEVVYDRKTLSVDETVRATATVTNNMATVAPMVILDLPIPAGFALQSADLERSVAAGEIAKYQLNPRSAVIYLRGLEPSRPLRLNYRLKATMPVKVTVQAAVAYEYYSPDRKALGKPASLNVTANAR